VATASIRQRGLNDRSPGTGRGKSGLRGTGWPLTAAPSDRGKVPQKRDRRRRPPPKAARVKRRGKSSLRRGARRGAGTPHAEQDRVGGFSLWRRESPLGWVVLPS